MAAQIIQLHPEVTDSLALAMIASSDAPLLTQGLPGTTVAIEHPSSAMREAPAVDRIRATERAV
jgi:hypothetical protein